MLDQTLPHVQAALAERPAGHVRDLDPAAGRWLENRLYPGADGITILFADVTETVAPARRGSGAKRCRPCSCRCSTRPGTCAIPTR